MTIYSIAQLIVSVVAVLAILLSIPRITHRMENRTLELRKEVFPIGMTVLTSVAATTAIHQVTTGSSVIDLVFLVDNSITYPLFIVVFIMSIVYGALFVLKRPQDFQRFREFVQETA